MNIFDKMREEQQEKRKKIIIKKKVPISEYIKHTDQDAQIESEQLCNFSNSDSLRKNLIWAGHDKVTNASETKNGNIKYHQQNKTDFCVTAYQLRWKFCDYIFQTQDYRDFLWTPSEEIIPGIYGNTCWIMPSQFRTFELTYQVDHVTPIAAGGLDELENYAFLTAMSNMFIKNQLPIDYLSGLYGGYFSTRIREVMNNRKDLFASIEWKEFNEQLIDFES